MGPVDRRPIEVGEIWENPVTRERVTILERPWDNPEGQASAELTALVGARVLGEHHHPALVERFTVLEGELALTAPEFSDMLVFRSPPQAVQRAIFGALAPIARWKGYRATYPQLSRIVEAGRA
jgi:hypothetical protein